MSRLYKFIIYTFFITSFIICDDAIAQNLSLDFGAEKAPLMTNKMIQFIGLITILTVAPSIMMMVTSFTRIIIVFSFLRNAMGLQQTPPNTVLASLALFLTFFIMSPTFMKAYEDGLAPLMNEEISDVDALPKISAPFHSFMSHHVREKDLSLFTEIAKIEVDKIENVPFHILIPAFMLSELKKAFEIGFLIFLPFLIIDMLVASVLMAMGMMMIPPVMISLPFKIIFFVLIDGWYMLCGSLVKSYAIP